MDAQQKQISPGQTWPSRAHWRLVGTVFAVLAFAAAAGFMLLSGPPAKPSPLRIAINPWPGYEFATLARELGYFEQEGVAVRLVELSSLEDSRRALERRQVDGMFSTIVEFVLYQNKSDRQAEIALVTDASNGADVILARRDLTSMRDLRGKRVAVEDASLNEVILVRALAQAGMSWNDVQVVHMPALDMPRAFEEGRVDAAVCYPPMALRITEQGASELFTTRQMPGIILDVLAFDGRAANDRRKDIDAFRRAFFRAMDYAKNNPDSAYSIMAARQGITASEFAEVLAGGIRLFDASDQNDFFGPQGRIQDALEQISGDLAIIAEAKSTRFATGDHLNGKD